MRTFAIIALVAAGACQYTGRPIDTGDDVPGLDGPRPDGPGLPDARIDATPSDPCLSWIMSWDGALPAEFDPCGIPPPTPGQITINSGTWTLDDNGVLSGANTINLAHITIDDVAIISVEKLEVLGSATLRIVGDDPIAIAVWTDATINGTIDASSDFNDAGAGADPNACPTNGESGDPDSGADQQGGDGGSGGGGFQGDGGDGSDGANGNGNGGGGGSGRSLPSKIEGGCSGAPAQSGTSGYAGVGGGAVMIAVLDTLLVTGTFNAGGGGGGGALGGGNEAGAGGGSGGMIKLHARSLTVTAAATLAANGGQGGGGNKNGDAEPGEDARADDTEALDTNNNEGGGGLGGGGGYLGRVSGAGATPNPSGDGGGGGGGGAGYIVYKGIDLLSIDLSATISPDGQTF